MLVGGLRLDETACDLAVCLAAVSSMLDRPITDELVAIGEVGLGGEVRSVNHLEARVREAARIGFKKMIVPKHALSQLDTSQYSDVEIFGVSYVRQAVELF